MTSGRIASRCGDPTPGSRSFHRSAGAAVQAARSRRAPPGSPARPFSVREHEQLIRFVDLQQRLLGADPEIRIDLTRRRGERPVEGPGVAVDRDQLGAVPQAEDPPFHELENREAWAAGLPGDRVPRPGLANGSGRRASLPAFDTSNRHWTLPCESSSAAICRGSRHDHLVRDEPGPDRAAHRDPPPTAPGPSKGRAGAAGFSRPERRGRSQATARLHKRRAFAPAGCCLAAASAIAGRAATESAAQDGQRRSTHTTAAPVRRRQARDRWPSAPGLTRISWEIAPAARGKLSRAETQKLPRLVDVRQPPESKNAAIVVGDDGLQTFVDVAGFGEPPAALIEDAELESASGMTRASG